MGKLFERAYEYSFGQSWAEASEFDRRHARHLGRAAIGGLMVFGGYGLHRIAPGTEGEVLAATPVATGGYLLAHGIGKAIHDVVIWTPENDSLPAETES